MAKRKSAAKKAARKSTPARRASAKRAAKGRGAAKAAKKALKKRAAKKTVARKAARKVAAKKVATRTVAKRTGAKNTAAKKAPAKAAKAPAPVARKAAAPRKAAKKAAAPTGTDRVSIPSSLGLDEGSSQAKSGRRAQREQTKSHNETSPELTGGDVDADWEGAYASGDEAPGGDNPTPDQDRVDEIGHALGVEYEDNEELKGADKIAERDKHRWELNPASSDDYRERD